MAVIMKTKKCVIFEKLGVDPQLVSYLEVANITVGVGFFDLIFYQGEVTIHSIKLPKSTNDLMKGVVTGMALSGLKGVVEHGIKTALHNVHFAGEAVALAPAPAPFDSTVPPLNIPAHTPEQLLKLAPVLLKDAVAVYQPVKGTSHSSRYVVVAMNEKVKVACRIAGDELSIRVEGDLTPEVVNAFQSVSVTKKDQYLSGHFALEGKVTHARLLGSILLGSGLKFDTVMPSMDILKGAM
jgi:hypothetical protein